MHTIALVQYNYSYVFLYSHYAYVHIHLCTCTCVYICSIMCTHSVTLTMPMYIYTYIHVHVFIYILNHMYMLLIVVYQYYKKLTNTIISIYKYLYYVQSIISSIRHSTKILSPRPFRPLSLLTSTILFSIIWMPTNYLYVRALMVIAATDVTAIFSTAPAFVFILSMIILREPPLLIRVKKLWVETV